MLETLAAELAPELSELAEGIGEIEAEIQRLSDVAWREASASDDAARMTRSAEELADMAWDAAISRAECPDDTFASVADRALGVDEGSAETPRPGEETGVEVNHTRELAVGEGDGRKAAGDAAEITEPPDESRTVRTWRESELYVLKRDGGEEQQAFKDGERVPFFTKGSTRPDIVREVDGHLEAVEVKNYDLSGNYTQMRRELVRQVDERVNNMPPGTTQRVCIDVGNRQYSELFLDMMLADLTPTLTEIDPSVIIELIP